MWETLASWDKTLFLFLNGTHTLYWDHFASIFTGKWVWVVMYAAILHALCKSRDWRVVATTTIAITLVIVAADQLTSSVLRPFFARPRPSHDPALEGLVHLINGRRGGAFGFPSAHAANTAGLTTFLAYLFRRRATNAFFIAWTLGTCYTRIYVGVHYPGDTLCGLLVGVVCGSGVYALFHLLTGDERPVLPSRLVVQTGLATTCLIGIYSLFLWQAE
jgi:undecaprenyl-diphosphatase